MEANKTSYFEYFVDNIYIDSNDLSVVKTQKLLFFLTISVKGHESNYPLLNTFDKFFALPYGHVESDIYSAIKNNDLINFKIDRFGTKRVGANIFDLDPEITNLIDFGIQNLIDYNLFSRSASYLVNLSHCHESWTKNYREALKLNKSSQIIPKSDIINEQKYFAL